MRTVAHYQAVKTKTTHTHTHTDIYMKTPTTLGFCHKNMLVAASVGRDQASLS